MKDDRIDVTVRVDVDGETLETAATNADERRKTPDAGTAGSTADGAAVGATATAESASPVEAEETPESRATFELYRDRADEWRWRLRHDNGNVIADGGEGYATKGGAKKGIRSVKANAAGAPVEEVK
uniref:HVO_2922 family protein n=1 Tax=Halegenticoccus tardaugens TaxID=2071624 RepID=UPI00100A3D9B